MPWSGCSAHIRVLVNIFRQPVSGLFITGDVPDEEGEYQGKQQTGSALHWVKHLGVKELVAILIY